METFLSKDTSVIKFSWAPGKHPEI